MGNDAGKIRILSSAKALQLPVRAGGDNERQERKKDAIAKRYPPFVGNVADEQGDEKHEIGQTQVPHGKPRSDPEYFRGKKGRYQGDISVGNDGAEYAKQEKTGENPGNDERGWIRAEKSKEKKIGNCIGNAMDPPFPVSQREVLDAQKDRVRSRDGEAEKKLEWKKAGMGEKRKGNDDEKKGECARKIEKGPAIEKCRKESI